MRFRAKILFITTVCLLLASLAVCIGTEAQYQYDGNGRLWTVTYGDGTSIVYRYDGNGNLISRTPPTYTITPSSEAGGSISPSGTVTVSTGGSQTFAITPNTGYAVVSGQWPVVSEQLKAADTNLETQRTRLIDFCFSLFTVL